MTLGMRHPLELVPEVYRRAPKRGSVLTEPRFHWQDHPIAGVPEQPWPTRGWTSRHSCREPRAIPAESCSHPNPPAATSVEPRTRPRWRTPLRPLLLLFGDAFQNPPGSQNQRGGWAGIESISDARGGWAGIESAHATEEPATAQPATKAIRLIFIMIAPNVW